MCGMCNSCYISSVGNQNDVSPTSNVVSPFPLKKLFLCIWMRQKEIHLLCKNGVNRPVTFWIITYFRSVVYPLPPVWQTQNVAYPYFWRYVILENLCPSFTKNQMEIRHCGIFTLDYSIGKHTKLKLGEARIGNITSNNQLIIYIT